MNEVNILSKDKVEKGSRWIYSADFNVTQPLRHNQRVDREVDDIKTISEAGGIVLILPHQGRYGKTKSLQFVADHLGAKYFDGNVGKEAVDFASSLKAGQIAIMGNTRYNEGEEQNSVELAKEFTKLGEQVVIGGFGKAHRVNASNHEILNHLPGYIAQNHLDEMLMLEPWTGRKDCSIAVLGGIKKEKITVGLAGFGKLYTDIIPGGIVVNNILKLIHGEVGSSILEDGGSLEEKCRKALQQSTAIIHIPDEVLVAEATETGYKNFGLVDLRKKKIQKNQMIVSYIVPDSAKRALDRCVYKNGRMLIAGTPDLYNWGMGLATNEVVQRLRNCNGLVLGGDTAQELDYDGTVSTGGGSALHYLVNGSTPIYEKLKEKFRESTKT